MILLSSGTQAPKPGSRSPEIHSFYMGVVVEVEVLEAPGSVKLARDPPKLCTPIEPNLDYMERQCVLVVMILC